MATAPFEILKTLYQELSSAQFSASIFDRPEVVQFQVAGKSALAGKYVGEAGLKNWVSRMKELSSGTYQLELHDLLISDRHAMALITHKIEQAGKPVEYRSVHVWRNEPGKMIAGYEYFRDQYQFDAIWGVAPTATT
ncbi:MAG: hypothetical protein EOP09_02765 [Proteobacteria bacterium]|nr:MAG: hypothetical protein EOP09_02765 [Pseudomonadota bacterium]